MEVGSADDVVAPESWEAVSVEESLKRLMLSSPSTTSSTKKDSAAGFSGSSSSELSFNASGSSSYVATERGSVAAGSLSEEAISQVDQFLREALQNPRERLSILRMEQEVEKFICDPTQQQLEFQQLPTSYLRLAAHRVAQHYFLQSMVLMDNSLPDGSGSRIIVRKTSTECHIPRIRLADIPVNLPQEDSGAIKMAIKQRPQKHDSGSNNLNSNSQKTNTKSVEERKEEYNRARARIFNANNPIGFSAVKPENEQKVQDSFQHDVVRMSKMEDKSPYRGSDSSTSMSGLDSSTGSDRSARSRAEKEPLGRYRPNNRVAIFRDRDLERKDPDYDRSYDRYMQRFDPGFGYHPVPYAIQPMYTPALNYNTEFPQLGQTSRPQVSAEYAPQPLPQHHPGPWPTPSNPPIISYGHPETIMTNYNPNHVGQPSTSAIYLHSSQYLCQRPGMPFIHPHEHIYQPFAQSHQQHGATLGLARPR